MPYRDAFNRANGPLGSDWATATGIFAISANVVQATDVEVPSVAAYTRGLWSPTQFSQATWPTASTDGKDRGVALRIQTGGYSYLWYGQSGSSLLLRYDLATGPNTLFTGAALAAGDVLYADVSGVGGTVTVRVYKNGALLSTIGDTDANRHTTAGLGAGLGAFGVDTTARLDNWSGGDPTDRGVLNRGLRPAPFRPGLARLRALIKDRHNGPAYRTVLDRAA